MNLFLLTWNVAGPRVPEALTELQKMADVYPHLDPSTVCCFGEGSSVFIASIRSPDNVVSPRIYVNQSNDQVTLYDGCLVDCTGSFPAHMAEELSLRWDDLPNLLEGQFVIARARIEPPCLEVMSDFLGIYQAYYLRNNNSWFISNSVRLLSRINNITEFDPLGVSMFLCVGWAGGDRTLRNGIRVFPGGQRWRWRKGDTEPTRETYFSRAQLCNKYQRKLGRIDVEQLARELIQIHTSLAQSFGPLECPITGGRDSRLMASLLMRGGIPGKYFTVGASESSDAQIGSQIADRFGLPHEIRGAKSDAVLERWEDASWRLVRQTDGMVTLAHIRNTLEPPLHIEQRVVHLYGAGGEIARGYYNSPRFLLHRHSIEFVQQYLTTRLLKERRNLVCEDAFVLAQQYLRDFLEGAADDGFLPIDLLDIFYAYERVRRWAGVQFRTILPIKDVFSPFCTRPFVKAAFSIPATHRYVESIHHQLLHFLVPELYQLPFEKSWRPQRVTWLPYHFLYARIKRMVSRKSAQETHKYSRAFERSAWLEAKCPHFRALCLDQTQSPLWNFVDRHRFQYITSRDTSPLERQRNRQALYDVVTLFQYALT